MYITFDLEPSDKSGKHKFINRLRPEFEKLGLKLSTDLNKSDIHLYVREWNSRSKCNICRLDGVWINTDESTVGAKKGNDNIIERIKNSDGVIFQNEFCKEAVNRILAMYPENHMCILNGADSEEFKVKPIKHDKPYFLAMCKWRPHKRLKQIVQGFAEANLDGVDLIVLGDPDYKKDFKNVVYKGWVGQKEAARYISGCVGSVHLAYLDWCANSCVESLVAGKQIIHTNSGGTPLLIKGRGYQIKDGDWDFNKIDLYNPPKLNLNEIAQAYINSYNNPIKNFNIDDLLISNIAKQYYDFFIKTIKKC